MLRFVILFYFLANANANQNANANANQNANANANDYANTNGKTKKFFNLKSVIILIRLIGFCGLLG